MERQEALRLLNANTAFEFIDGKVVLRDERLLAAVAELRTNERYTPEIDSVFIPHARDRRVLPRLG